MTGLYKCVNINIFSFNFSANACNPNPCNGGSCTDNGRGPVCECKDTGYTGQMCEQGKWFSFTVSNDVMKAAL